MSEFNPRKAVTELVNSTPNGPGRKLSFFDKCAAFYAVFNGARHGAVAEAFGISRIAVSQLAGCLKHDPRPRFQTLGDGTIIKNPDLNEHRDPNRKRRYQDVAAEFRRLGEEAFAERYYPESVHLRLMAIKHGMDEEAGRRARRGPDPTPDGKPNYRDIPNGPRIFLAWVDKPNPPGPSGWYNLGPDPNSKTHYGANYSTGGDQWPFATQKKARDAICPEDEL